MGEIGSNWMGGSDESGGVKQYEVKGGQCNQVEKKLLQSYGTSLLRSEARCIIEDTPIGVLQEPRMASLAHPKGCGGTRPYFKVYVLIFRVARTASLPQTPGSDHGHGPSVIG
jgi:hypothetical protein